MARFHLVEHEPSGARAQGVGGLVVKVLLVEPVTRPVPQDVMAAHRAQADPVEMA